MYAWLMRLFVMTFSLYDKVILLTHPFAYQYNNRRRVKRAWGQTVNTNKETDGKIAVG